MPTLNATAETKWCPISFVKSDVQERSFSGNWQDRRIGQSTTQYSTSGKSIAVCSINRLDDGSPHPKTLCQTNDCMFWRKYDGTTSGFCSRFDDNMNGTTDQDDVDMLTVGCPHGFKMLVETRPWTGTISGDTITATGVNRDYTGKFITRCVASKCMAYRSHGSSAIGYCMASDNNMQKR